MTSFLLYVALISSVTTQHPVSYATARAQSELTRQPILVLVGADWCPACRVMKQSTLPQLRAAGNLKDVLYAVVDVDAEPQLAGRIMQSSSIPQLVLYTPGSEGWYQMRLVGAQPGARVTAMIKRGLSLQVPTVASRGPVTQ